jgi:dephospho-CoA kinase
MRVLALTGNVAAGKSTVAARLRELGAVLIDADAIVRSLQEPGTPVHARMVAHFGPEILAPDGTLDRQVLRGRILAEPAERLALEAIVHPAVEEERRRQLARAAAAGAEVVIAEIPLLFEAADPSVYDGVILVDAPVAERRRRLIAERGLPPAQADQLLAAQWPAASKRARATWIIDNDADRATLLDRTDALWHQITH